MEREGRLLCRVERGVLRECESGAVSFRDFGEEYFRRRGFRFCDSSFLCFFHLLSGGFRRLRGSGWWNFCHRSLEGLGIPCPL